LELRLNFKNKIEKVLNLSLILIVSFGTIFYGLVSFDTFIYSQESEIAVPDAGITISPVRFEYDLDPGETISDEILIYNATGRDEQLFFATYPFTPNENGTPQIIKDGELPYEVDPSQWISLNKESAVVEDQVPERAIPTRLGFTLTIPEDAAAGGYYAAVLQSQKPQDGSDLAEGESGTVTIPESAALVIVNVSGDINKELQVSDFYVTDPYSENLEPQGGFLGTPIFEYPPVQFVTTLENTGNTHVRSTGQIYVKQGGEQIATFPFNEDKGLVLRESTRTFAPRFPANYINMSDEEKEDIKADVWGYEEVLWSNQPVTAVETTEDGSEIERVQYDQNGQVQTTVATNFRYLDNIPFGEYEAELAVIFQDETESNQNLTQTVSFWVLPWKIILLIIAIILAVIGTLIVIYRKGSKDGKKKNDNKNKR
jgi:hypothetical protein